MTAIMTPTATADSTVLVHSYLSSAAGVGSSEPSSLVFYFCSAWHPRSVFSPTTPSRKTPRFASGRRPEATCLGRVSLVGMSSRVSCLEQPVRCSSRWSRLALPRLSEHSAEWRLVSSVARLTVPSPVSRMCFLRSHPYCSRCHWLPCLPATGSPSPSPSRLSMSRSSSESHAAPCLRSVRWTTCVPPRVSVNDPPGSCSGTYCPTLHRSSSCRGPCRSRGRCSPRHPSAFWGWGHHPPPHPWGRWCTRPAPSSPWHRGPWSRPVPSSFCSSWGSTCWATVSVMFLIPEIEEINEPHCRRPRSARHRGERSPIREPRHPERRGACDSYEHRRSHGVVCGCRRLHHHRARH